MDDKRCKEQVWADWHEVPCDRKAGHGEGGDYCKQHALRHPAGKPTVEVWEVTNHDLTPRPRLVHSATEKTVVLGTSRTPRVTQYARYFDMREDAFAYALERAENAVRRAEAEHLRAKVVRDDLRAASAKGSKRAIV